MIVLATGYVRKPVVTRHRNRMWSMTVILNTRPALGKHIRVAIPPEVLGKRGDLALELDNVEAAAIIGHGILCRSPQANAGIRVEASGDQYYTDRVEQFARRRVRMIFYPD